MKVQRLIKLLKQVPKDIDVYFDTGLQIESIENLEVLEVDFKEYSGQSETTRRDVVIIYK